MIRILALISLSLMALSGCHTVGGSVRIGTAPEPHPHYAEPMPPAHAPAYGRRAQVRHHYYYYPEASFYFDVTRNVYFDLDSRGRWEISANLPRHLHLQLNSGYVELDMESERPYVEHHHHQKQYPRGKWKKHHYKEKHKEKGKGKRHDRDDDRDDDRYLRRNDYR